MGPGNWNHPGINRQSIWTALSLKYGNHQVLLSFLSFNVRMTFLFDLLESKRAKLHWAVVIFWWVKQPISLVLCSPISRATQLLLLLDAFSSITNECYIFWMVCNLFVFVKRQTLTGIRLLFNWIDFLNQKEFSTFYLKLEAGEFQKCNSQRSFNITFFTAH